MCEHPHPLHGDLHKAVSAPMPQNEPDFASPAVLRQFKDVVAAYNARLVAIRDATHKAIHAAVARTAG